ncbi:hypothetical protein QT711_11270 [Sporosarcina saromensis]|uniref:DUF7210 domain-containing protein n=1 Tax=Sporosarcina saromensis TaxID=359365 RepID=A0ABU4GBS9_9BACL|nr:hypothetical protein [Sporosarcina saromensis]MDW0113768.1 hypothetical protein [Sporosarcina saromensis]
MEVKTKAIIKHNGKWYQVGEEIKKISKEDGGRLIERGLAVETESSIKERAKAEEAAQKAAEEKAKKEAEEKAKEEVAKKQAEEDAAKAEAAKNKGK